MTGLNLAALKRELAQAAQGDRAGSLAWFKTGKGEYGEGDKFIGVRVPAQRAIAAKYRRLGLEEIGKLLVSRIHEHRFTGLLILVAQYEGGDESIRLRVFSFYLDHTCYINNWDLVDVSAPAIVGQHLLFRARRVLYRLAKSPDWWERRIAMVATAAFIDRGDLQDTFAIAARLLADRHDLIHKATGWMLREAGAHSRSQLRGFLKRHYSQMPRTTCVMPSSIFRKPKGRKPSEEFSVDVTEESARMGCKYLHDTPDPEPTISLVVYRFSSYRAKAGSKLVLARPGPSNFLSMDWTDLHCQRQFKRARNCLPIAYSRERTKTEASGWVGISRKAGAQTIRTCDLCLRRANANQPRCPAPTEIERLGQYLDEPRWIS